MQIFNGSSMIKTHLVPCNLCGSKNTSFICKARDRLHGVEGEFNYVKCSECGLIYMNPQVVPEDIPQLYPSNYAPHHSRNKKKRFGFISELCSYLTSMAKIRKEIYNCLDNESRVLDVGCGSGSILNDIRKRTGCQVYGVDISENAVQTAKELYGIDIFKGDIKDSTWQDNYFDVITAWQYLEHVNDPNQNVEKMCRLLKNSGWLILGIPNYKSLHAKWFKNKWFPLDCPRHLCLWSPQTITKLINKHGLKVEYIVYDMTPWSLIGSLQYLIYGDNLNPGTKNRLMYSRCLLVLMFPWTLLMSLLKCSDVIIVYARKQQANE
ncbi:MAG: class I SAM-dependent methyltransferase [Sedimentisphaerales bacterium]|nr:class I SAM-dependent methyltransferase [Sedimentisphaerales bacterium]